MTWRGGIVVPILQVRKLRFRKIKGLIQDSSSQSWHYWGPGAWPSQVLIKGAVTVGGQQKCYGKGPWASTRCQACSWHLSSLGWNPPNLVPQGLSGWIFLMLSASWIMNPRQGQDLHLSCSSDLPNLPRAWHQGGSTQDSGMPFLFFSKFWFLYWGITD